MSMKSSLLTLLYAVTSQREAAAQAQMQLIGCDAPTAPAHAESTHHHPWQSILASSSNVWQPVLVMQMYLKIDITLQLMQLHHWQSVLLSDTDVAWLRQPLGLLQMYPQADMLVATDCLSQKAVDDRRKDVPRCGTIPEANVRMIVRLPAPVICWRLS